MPFRPGKYNDLATNVREASMAKAAIVVIIDGNKGSGFSVQIENHQFKVIENLPELLRVLAKEIEASIKG